jgi:hypothetical protein
MPSPHKLAAPPAITNAVEILNALRECRAPLKLSSFETRDGISKGYRNKAPVVADAVPVVDVGGVSVPVVDVGGVSVSNSTQPCSSQAVKSNEKEMYVCYLSNAADEEERGEGQEPQW